MAAHDLIPNEATAHKTALLQRFDVVNAFATARVVITMYQRALERIIRHTKEDHFDFFESWGSKFQHSSQLQVRRVFLIVVEFGFVGT